MAQVTGGAGDGSDPMQAAIAGAQALRHLFGSYVLAGFNDAQALYLVGVVVSATVRAQHGPLGSDGG